MSKFIATQQHLQQIEHLVTEIPSRYVNLAQGILTIVRSFEPVKEEAEGLLPAKKPAK